MAAAAVLVAGLLVVCAAEVAVAGSVEFQPHTTLVDLRKLKDNHRKQVLDPQKPNITIGFLSSFKVSGAFIFVTCD